MIYSGLYDCIYSAVGKAGNSREELPERDNIGDSLSRCACFGRTLSQLRNFEYAEITYKVYLYKDDLPNKNFNLCTKKETRKILKCFQKVVDFTYHFEEGTYRASTYGNAQELPFNILVVNLRGKTAQHVWLTTMLRVFFEYPYNVAAKEACTLQSQIKSVNEVSFAKESWLNIYMTIVALLGSGQGHGLVGWHQLPQPKLKSYHDWKHTIENIHRQGRICNQLERTGRNFSANIRDVRITNQREYDQGTQSRAAMYAAAYKDKLSWKN